MTCRGCERIRKVLGLSLVDRGLAPVVRHGMFKNGLTPAQKIMRVSLALVGVAIGLLLIWAGAKGTAASGVWIAEAIVGLLR